MLSQVSQGTVKIAQISPQICHLAHLHEQFGALSSHKMELGRATRRFVHGMGCRVDPWKPWACNCHMRMPSCECKCERHMRFFGAAFGSVSPALAAQWQGHSAWRGQQEH